MVSGQRKQWERRGLPVFIEDGGHTPNESVRRISPSIHPPMKSTIFLYCFFIITYFFFFSIKLYELYCVNIVHLLCSFHYFWKRTKHSRQQGLCITNPKCVGQTRSSKRPAALINEQGGEHEADRRERQRSLSLAQFISPCVCAYFSSFTIPNRPASSQAGRAAPFHSHMSSSSATTGKGLLCSCLQVLSPTSLRVDLVIIINNCGPGRDKPSAFQNSWFCLWDGVARTDKLGVYLKAFYFGQRSAHHRERSWNSW